MLKQFAIVVLLLASAMATAAATAANDPTMHQVYQAAQAGKLNEAQSMMGQVLHDHPDSAKAHFVEAELLARQGRMTSARSELETAQRLAPGLPFAKPQSVQQLESRLAGGSATMAPGAYGHRVSRGLPWGTLLLGIGALAAIVIAVRAMNRRNQAFYPGGPAARYGSGYPGQPYAPGGTPYPSGPMGGMGGGLGSGIVGGLATGAALGAGMVAGEELMHHFTDGNQTRLEPTLPADTSWNSAPDDMGGSDFGINDSASWDDGGGGWDSSGDDWN